MQMTMKRPGRPKADDARDLRADLLSTSRALLEEGGPAALSLREVARRAGCTHQAPYHYFKDREAILATLVAEGFDDLARRLAAANDIAATKGARAGLLASGRAYVEFALSHPGVFRVMFRNDLCDPQRNAAVREAGGRAWQELSRLRTLVFGADSDPALATILWAHVHGLSSLLIDSPMALSVGSGAGQRAMVEAAGETFATLLLGSHT